MAYNFDREFEIRDARDGDWFWANRFAVSDTCLTPADKVIYFGLCCFISRFDRLQQVYPSINRLSKQTGLSPRQIKRSTKRLAELGYITKISNQSGNKTTYALLSVSSANFALLHKEVPIWHYSSANLSNSGANGTPVTVPINTLDKDILNNIPVSKKNGCPLGANGEHTKYCVDLINRVAEEKGIKAFPNYGKQINAVHMALRAGFKLEDVEDMAARLLESSFWNDRGWDLMDVMNRLGKGSKNVT